MYAGAGLRGVVRGATGASERCFGKHTQLNTWTGSSTTAGPGPQGYASTDALSDASRTTPRYSFSSPGFGVAGDAGGGGAGGGGGEKGEDGDGGGGGASSAGYLTRAQL